MKAKTFAILMGCLVSNGVVFGCPAINGNYVLYREMIVPGENGSATEVEESVAILNFTKRGNVLSAGFVNEFRVNSSNPVGLKTVVPGSPLSPSRFVQANANRDCTLSVHLNPVDPAADILLIPQSNGASWLGVSQDEAQDSSGNNVVGQYRKLVEKYTMTRM